MKPSKGYEGEHSTFSEREHALNVVEQLKRDDPDWSYQLVESSSGKS